MRFLTVTVFSFLVSLSAFAQKSYAPFLFDEYRNEIKEMASDHHNPKHGYSGARKYIMQKIHLNQDHVGYFVFDVYCSAKFRASVGPRKMPNHTKLNIEHTWPRSRFGERKGGSKFRKMEADLHHLYPTDSRANSTRGNYKFSQFERSGTPLRDCPSSKRGYISSSGEDGFEPPESHKGNVARALFYMAVRYDLRISAQEEFYLRQWNLIDPVDQAEERRNEMISEIQGNRNPFIDDPELADLISDF